jgi:peptide/nickel transport system substrate-binding protein
MFLWQAPNIVNPHLALGVKDQFVSRIAYEPLASFDNEGNLVPFLAAEIPSLENGGLAADGKSVTWKLKENVFWSDGEPFTADDVLFTYEYISNPEIGSSSGAAYTLVENVEVIADHTVKVIFTDVNPNWTVAFVGIRGMILPRHIFEDYTGTNYGDAPANRLAVGTGPYRVVDFVNEDILLIGNDVVTTTRVSFEPNPYYRDPDKPYFSRLEVQGEAVRRITRLKSCLRIRRILAGQCWRKKYI